MIFGYARVSTDDQSLDLQIEALEKAGCFHIFSEKVSGTKIDGRAELRKILGFIQEGDVLVCTRLDRLARSIPDLYAIVGQLQTKGASLKCTEQPIDMTTASGKAFLGMLGVFAQFETELRRERQIEGIERAKKRGAYIYGRGRRKHGALLVKT